MKVLVSAIACNPSGSSESHFGWQAVLAISKLHDVWVVTSERYRSAIEEAREQGEVPRNVQFLFHGLIRPWHQNRLIARFQSWLEYRRWAKTLPPKLAGWHQEIGFDVAHHVTYATWRVASPLRKLGIPFIWGPVGGGEVFPKSLLHVVSRPARIFERLRDCSNWVASFSPAIRQSAKQAAKVFVANKETADQLLRVGTAEEKIEELSAAFFSSEHFRKFEAPFKAWDGRLEIFAGGNLEGRKGVAIALKALRRVADQGIDFRYTLGGRGPEFEYLQRLAKDLDLADRVAFTEGFSGDSYAQRLASSHVYLLPSLRDSAGLTLMEAMLSRCVPVVADCGGPGTIVTEDCGCKLPTVSEEKMVEAIAEKIVLLATSPEIRQRLGDEARARIMNFYSADHYIRKIERAYAEAVVGASH